MNGGRNDCGNFNCMQCYWKKRRDFWEGTFHQYHRRPFMGPRIRPYPRIGQAERTLIWNAIYLILGFLADPTYGEAVPTKIIRGIYEEPLPTIP